MCRQGSTSDPLVTPQQEELLNSLQHSLTLDAFFSTQEALHPFLKRSTASENKPSQCLFLKAQGAEGHHGCQQEAKWGLAGSTGDTFKFYSP